MTRQETVKENKMNKYQEALDRLKNITSVPSIFIFETVKELVEIFQELVDKVSYYKELEDKETPKKPIGGLCPICNSSKVIMYPSDDSWFEELKHCPDCGQKLKWTNND